MTIKKTKIISSEFKIFALAVIARVADGFKVLANFESFILYTFLFSLFFRAFSIILGTKASALPPSLIISLISEELM